MVKLGGVKWRTISVAAWAQGILDVLYKVANCGAIVGSFAGSSVVSTAYAADQNAAPPAAPNAGQANSGETPAAPTHPARSQSSKEAYSAGASAAACRSAATGSDDAASRAAPRVTYQNGMLAIAAQNLRWVRFCGTSQTDGRISRHAAIGE